MVQYLHTCEHKQGNRTDEFGKRTRAHRPEEERNRAIPRDIERAGLYRSHIARLVDQGAIERLARALPRPGGTFTERSDLAHAARLVPEGVICLLTALRFHSLSTQNPFEVWMAIDRTSWRPRPDHPPMRIIYLSGRALADGIEEHKVEGVSVRVFSAAKTVADCFKFRYKICPLLTAHAL